MLSGNVVLIATSLLTSELIPHNVVSAGEDAPLHCVLGKKTRGRHYAHHVIQDGGTEKNSPSLGVYYMLMVPINKSV